MKFTKRLISFVFGISIIIGTTFAITSCSKHENPWSSIKVGDNFTIHSGDADDMIAIAKTHIQQAESDAGFADIFNNLPANVGRDEVYWSIAYGIAWYVKNDQVHADRTFDMTSAGYYINASTPYAIKCKIGGGEYTGNPTAVVDSTNNIYQMAIGGTQIGLAYILDSFKP